MGNYPTAPHTWHPLRTARFLFAAQPDAAAAFRKPLPRSTHAKMPFVGSVAPAHKKQIQKKTMRNESTPSSLISTVCVAVNQISLPKATRSGTVRHPPNYLNRQRHPPTAHQDPYADLASNTSLSLRDPPPPPSPHTFTRSHTSLLVLGPDIHVRNKHPFRLFVVTC